MKTEQISKQPNLVAPNFCVPGDAYVFNDCVYICTQTGMVRLADGKHFSYAHYGEGADRGARFEKVNAEVRWSRL